MEKGALCLVCVVLGSRWIGFALCGFALLHSCQVCVSAKEIVDETLKLHAKKHGQGDTGSYTDSSCLRRYAGFFP